MGVRHEGVPEESIMAPCSLEHCSKHDRFIHSFVCFENRATITHSIVPIRRWSHQTHTHAHTHSLLRTFTSLLSLLFVHSLFIHSYIRCALACFVGYPSCFATARRRTKKSVEFQTKRNQSASQNIRRKSTTLLERAASWIQEFLETFDLNSALPHTHKPIPFYM